MSNHRSNHAPKTPRKPAVRAQVYDSKRISRPLHDLIEGHAARLLHQGAVQGHIPEQVSGIVGVPLMVAEVVVNQFFRRLLVENSRWRNGIMNTISHVNATRRDLEEEAA